MDLGGELKAIGAKNECGGSISADGLNIAQNAEESQLRRIVLCRFNSDMAPKQTNMFMNKNFFLNKTRIVFDSCSRRIEPSYSSRSGFGKTLFMNKHIYVTHKMIIL
jgi:hypothetical protein